MTSRHANSLTSPGRCYLVGAGPGDPELLTIKAFKLIQSATLLLVDDLVSADIVKLASPKTRVIAVGKRGGRESTSQEFIEKLMIMAARQGEVVVRLKGGDPFILAEGVKKLNICALRGCRWRWSMALPQGWRQPPVWACHSPTAIMRMAWCL